MKEKNPPSILEGATPLDWAAEHGHLEVCKLIIKKLEVTTKMIFWDGPHSMMLQNILEDLQTDC